METLPAVWTGPAMQEKARELTNQGETLIWLLATKAEAEQLKDGQVPDEIRQQAEIALDAIGGGGLYTKRSKARKRKA